MDEAKTIEMNKSEESRAARRNKRGGLPFRLFDLLIIAAVAVLSLLPLLLLPARGSETVVITWHGEEIYRGGVEKDAVIVTPDGLNTIVIYGGRVRMEEASCADRICVRTGYASPSKPLVCLPNRVIVNIIGSEEVDGVTW